MKGKFITILALLLTVVLLSSCGSLKRHMDTGIYSQVKSKTDAAERYQVTPQFKPNSDSTSSTKVTPDNKAEAVKDSTSIQMQDLSDEMDKLDSIMNGLDDSTDINDTEKAINNLK